jgi:hypothetical protein
MKTKTHSGQCLIEVGLSVFLVTSSLFLSFKLLARADRDLQEGCRNFVRSRALLMTKVNAGDYLDRSERLCHGFSKSIVEDSRGLE